MANEVEIVITSTDRTNFGAVQRSAENTRGGITSTFKDIGKVAGGFLVAELTTQLTGWASKGLGWLWDGTKLASDTQEAMNKVNVVFGTSAGQIRTWAEGSADSIGLSERAALDAAGTFGNLFSQLGFTADETANMSTGIVDLAADFASFHNADITDVVDAQSAAFRGEYDSLRRFLPLISAAVVEQKALEQTGKASTKELTAQEKAFAVNTLMYEGAGAALGDFSATSEDVANKERRVAAEAENLQAALGQRLLPISIKVTEAKLALVRAIEEKVIPFMERMAATIKDNVQPIMEWLGDYSFVVKGALVGLAAVVAAIVVPAFISMAVAVFSATWPLIAAAVVIGAIAAALIWAYENVGPFREAVDRAKDALIGIATAAWDFIEGIDWQAIWDTLEPIFTRLGVLFTLFMELVGEVLNLVMNEISKFVTDAQQFWDAHGDKIMEGARRVWDWVEQKIGAALDVIEGILEAALGLITGDWERAWNGVKLIASGIWNSIKADFFLFTSAIKGAAGGIWDGILSGLKAVVDGVVVQINRLIDAYNRIPGVPDIPRIAAGGGSGAGGGAGSRTFGGGSGGRTFAAPVPNQRTVRRFASGGIASGLSEVAETAKELLQFPGGGQMLALPAGTRVNSGPQTARMLDGGGGGSYVVVNVAGSVLSERDLRGVVADAIRGGGLDRLTRSTGR